MTSPVLRGIFTAVSIGLGSCIGLFSSQTEPPLDTSICGKANTVVSACVAGVGPVLPADPALCTGSTNCQGECFANASCGELQDLFAGGSSTSLVDCTQNCF